MKKIPATIEIKDVQYVSGFTLAPTFSVGEKKEVDFAPFLKVSQHPEVQEYLKLNKFKHYSVKNGDLMWGDFDLIFPVADLYKNSEMK